MADKSCMTLQDAGAHSNHDSNPLPLINLHAQDDLPWQNRKDDVHRAGVNCRSRVSVKPAIYAAEHPDPSRAEPSMNSRVEKVL